ncbi:hypothetical protein Poli38472_010933 [Pythium oligandrum]|uniref:Essential protein Yae1 N-terminal domain-containing protein n=2 Tax=Pythiaceae TaxID=4782 RepID=A0A8K1CES4_PYTOL|nr:hypothetical protein Poli38472_010933 [Pythium oligandrum]DBA03592.1 TPA: hypothetical protein N0F65_006771 [Lagenidium giganteum]|eukprot:TMW61870.1 hypothetical protein Poli38472_010933 [Pythium oligandrum]
MANMHGHDGEDDGFDDFLSEEEEECTLQTQEREALVRRMKTVGVREGIEFGKESTLQEGFDKGFNTAVTDAFRFGVLRGALSVALVSQLFASFKDEEVREIEACVEALRTRSLRVPSASSEPPSDVQADEVVVTLAQQWLARVGIQTEDKATA